MGCAARTGADRETCATMIAHRGRPPVSLFSGTSPVGKYSVKIGRRTFWHTPALGRSVTFLTCLLRVGRPPTGRRSLLTRPRKDPTMLQALLDLVTNGQLADVLNLIGDVVTWEE
ncbi:hypothetical protein GCM10009583_23430 [Ornithinicoccus hortensis]